MPINTKQLIGRHTYSVYLPDMSKVLPENRADWFDQRLGAGIGAQLTMFVYNMLCHFGGGEYKIDLIVENVEPREGDSVD